MRHPNALQMNLARSRPVLDTTLHWMVTYSTCGSYPRVTLRLPQQGPGRCQWYFSSKRVASKTGFLIAKHFLTTPSKGIFRMDMAVVVNVVLDSRLLIIVAC